MLALIVIAWNGVWFASRAGRNRIRGGILGVVVYLLLGLPLWFMGGIPAGLTLIAATGDLTTIGIFGFAVQLGGAYLILYLIYVAPLRAGVCAWCGDRFARADLTLLPGKGKVCAGCGRVLQE